MQEHEQPRKLGRNAPCHCGADRKYKKCCARVEDERQRGPGHYENLSIKSIVLEEIRTFREIFVVKLTDDELEISKNITDSDVLLLVERVRNLWRSKVDLLPQMPAKTDLRFRALFFGNPDILSTVNLLARYSLYCDQIIVIDPLSIFHGMNKTFRHSPFQDPQSWVRQIVRNGVYLSSLEEWVRNDLIFATAFPLSLHDPLKQKHVAGMKAKFEQLSPDKWDEIVRDTIEAQFYSAFTPAELAAMEPQKAEMELIRRLAEDDEWWNRVSPHMPEITRAKAIDTLKSMKRQKEEIGGTIARLRQEPRRYEWALDRQFEPRMNVFGSGMNLLDAEWFAELTGSHLVTDR
jgi:SEC-C motif